MVPIYIGLAVLIVLILGGFGIANYLTNRSTAAAVAFDTATPTPGPNARSRPIQLANQETLGKNYFPISNLQKMILPDTSTGGHGQDVDGIPCQTSEAAVVHVHSHVALFVNGKQIAIPADIGITPSMGGGCLYWLHTQDASGIIQVEPGRATAPNGSPYALGNFFDIWGLPLSSNQAGPFKGNVIAFVNGGPYSGDLRAIPLRSHQQITLEVGSPVVPPPNYRLPEGL